MARLQPSAITNLPVQDTVSVVEVITTASATKNCARCATTNPASADACMVCKHKVFRASKPAPQRFRKPGAKVIVGSAE